MSTTAKSLAELGYGAFYLSSISFGYLSIESPNFVSNSLDNITIFPPILTGQIILFGLALIAFLGALQVHGISQAVYGPDGPKRNPKFRHVQIRHSFSIMLGKDADKIPQVPPRILAEGPTKEFAKYLEDYMKENSPKGVTESYEFSYPNHEKYPRRRRLEVAYHQLKEIYSGIGFEEFLRIIYFIPSGLIRYLTYVSFLFLSALFVSGSLSYIAMLLLAGHFVLLFRHIFWKPIPEIYSTDNLSDINKPEYEICRENTQPTTISPSRDTK